MDQENSIFLSYASPDRSRVEDYYDFLLSGGFHPWMDKHELRGGQDWNFELKRALGKAAIIVVFLSNQSVEKRGYCQREIKIALDCAQNKLPSDTFIIPVAIDPHLAIPEQLQHLQVIRADEVDSFSELERSITAQFEKMGGAYSRIVAETGLSWEKEFLTDKWDGLPGYDFKYELIKLSSPEFPEISRISDILQGDAARRLLGERRVMFDQMPDFYNLGQDRDLRQNSLEVTTSDPSIVNRVMSIVQDIYAYYGGAHPSHGHIAYNFITDPLVELDRIENIFSQSDNSFIAIQEFVRRELLKDRADGERLDEEAVRNGTADWESFQCYFFSTDGLSILFAPYEVGPYAAGSHMVTIPFANIVRLVRRDVACALGIEHLASL